MLYKTASKNNNKKHGISLASQTEIVILFAHIKQNRLIKVINR